jgi:CHAD domain-containing protein
MTSATRMRRRIATSTQNSHQMIPGTLRLMLMTGSTARKWAIHAAARLTSQDWVATAGRSRRRPLAGAGIDHRRPGTALYMTSGSTETELKYEAEAGIALPAFERLPQVSSIRDAPAEHLDAEYYDTSDLRLIRAGITLRRREGGHDAGWHLKLPAGADSRREIGVPLGGNAVPEALAQLVRVHSRGQELRPVARIRTDRRRLLLLGPSGSELAEVATDEVTAEAMDFAASTWAVNAAAADPGAAKPPLANPGAARISHWREIEVELTGGDRDLLTAADQLLRADGVSRSAQRAKLDRALGLPPAAPAAPPPLSASAPAWHLVMAYLRGQVEVLTSQDPLVRRDEPDSVHQMRIATRRLRSTLQTFGRLFRKSDTEHLATELRWLGRTLGQARDAEVMQGHLTERAGEVPVAQLIGPVQARIGGHFARARADGRVVVIEALESPRYFSLLDRLDEVLAAPPLTDLAERPARDVVRAAVRRAYKRTTRRVRLARRAPAGDRRDQALHRARRAAKRARYAGELAAPAFRGAGKFAAQMKHVQSVLGDHQDAVIAREVDRELGIAAHLAGENAFTYGLLYDRDDQDTARLRRKAWRTWRTASRGRYRRWLG